MSQRARYLGKRRFGHTQYQTDLYLDH